MDYENRITPGYDPDDPAALRDDGFAVKHVESFSGIVGGVAKTYRARFDEALRQSEGDALAMKRDGFLFGLLRERQMPTARAPWHIEPEDERDPVQKAASLTVTRAINSIPRLTSFRLTLLEAIWYGKHGAQIIPGKSKTRHTVTTVARWQPLHGDKIVYRHDGTAGILVHSAHIGAYKDKGATVLPTDRGMALFLDTPAWRERFIVHAHEHEDADYREPELAGKVHGVGLRDHCYWLWWIKAEVEGWLLNYLGRVGAGGLTLIGYDEGNPASIAAARAVANDLQTGNILLVPRPKGTDKATVVVDRIEPNTAGSQVLIDIVTEHYENKIERLFVGQSMSGGSDNESGLGGTGRAKFAADTKFQMVAVDADHLDDTLSEWLVAPLLRWNLPGVDFQLRFRTDLAKPDPAKQLEATKVFLSMGGEVADSQARELAGLEKPQPGAKVLSKRRLEQMTRPPVPPPVFSVPPPAPAPSPMPAPLPMAAPGPVVVLDAAPVVAAEPSAPAEPPAPQPIVVNLTLPPMPTPVVNNYLGDPATPAEPAGDRRVEFEYDAEGNPVASVVYEGDKMIRRVELTLNADGNPTSGKITEGG